MPRVLAFRSCTLALCALAFTACGGGGGASDPAPSSPTPIVVDLPLDLARTGIASSNGQTQAGQTLSVGDTATNLTVRGIVTFSLSQIPAGATIQVAGLRISQVQVANAPYATLGTVDVDHVDLLGALDAADFGSVALAAAVATLSGSANLEVKVAEVTGRVVADIAAGRTVSSFRLQFGTGTDNDGADDVAILRGLNPGEEMVLRVSYLAP